MFKMLEPLLDNGSGKEVVGYLIFAPESRLSLALL